MQDNPISIVLIDEHLLFRRVLSNYLVRKANINVVFEGSHLSDLLGICRHLDFDVLVADIPAHRKNTREIIRQIKKIYPLSKLLLFSMISDIAWIGDLLEMGIFGCVSKRDTSEELRAAIATVAMDSVYRNHWLTDALYHNQGNNYSVSQEMPEISLSDREKLLLRLMWQEKSNKEIADEMLLSVRSVEKMRQDLREKLQVKSVIGLLKYAIERNIYPIENLFSNNRNEN